MYIDFIAHVSSYFLQSTLQCSCFILFPWVHTSLIMFHFHFLQSTVHLIYFTYHRSISFMFTLFCCIHITWPFNLIVSFTFQTIPSLEINDVRVSLEKFLILDRYSLLEADLRCFYYSLSLYFKQEIQHGVKRNALVCSVTDVYLLIYST